MTRETAHRFYGTLGLALMTITLLTALGAVFDPALWWCVPGGYASALLMAWFDRHPIDD